MCKTKLELCQVSLNYLTTPDLRIWVCVSLVKKTAFLLLKQDGSELGRKTERVMLDYEVYSPSL